MSNGKVLIIALSQKWGLLEKNIIQDSVNMPYEVTLYVARDSFIDMKAKELGLSRVFYKGATPNATFDIIRYRELKKIIKTYQFDLIHVAHFQSIWSMCLLLRKDRLTPLTLAATRIFKKYFKNPFYRLLMSRVDKFFVPSIEHQENVLAHFKLSPSKVIVTGMGLVFSRLRRPKLDDRFVISVFVGNHEQNLERYRVLFHSIPVVNDNLERKKMKLVLNFVTEKPWNTHLLYQILQEEAVLYGMGDYISFTDSSADPDFETHMWLDVGKDESIASIYTQSLCEGVPVVLARRPYVLTALKYGGDFGESFKTDDARELQDKCVKIFAHYKDYIKGTKKMASQLIETNGRESYETVMFKHLESSRLRRLRVSQRRKNR